MVSELSITSENNINDTMNEAREEDENKMDIDGPADSTSTTAEPQLEPYNDEEEENLGNIEKIQELYVSGPLPADDDADGAVDTVIIFETLEPIDISNINDSPNSAEHRDFMSLCSRVIEEFFGSDDLSPIYHLTQEQLFIDWLTSRHLLTNNDDDE